MAPQPARSADRKPVGRKAGTKAGTAASANLPTSKADGRFAPGADPRRNTTKPGPGRPPDKFRALMRQLASSPETVKAVTQILQDADHPGFGTAFKTVTAYGYGAPTQTVEVSGEITSPVVLLPALTPL